MKELEEPINAILKKLPDEYGDVVLRLKVNGDWKAIEMVLSLIRERILDIGKSSGDGRVLTALAGFDAVFRILDKIAGTWQSRAAVERQVFALKEMEEVK